MKLSGLFKNGSKTKTRLSDLFRKRGYENLSKEDSLLPPIDAVGVEIPETPEKHCLNLDVGDAIPSEKTPILDFASVVGQEPASCSACTKSVDNKDNEGEEDEAKDDKNEEKRRPKIDRRVKFYLGLLAFVTLLSACKLALPAPFFPQEARKKGASSTVVGLIFSLFEFVTFTSSPLFGRYVPFFGPTWLYMAGIFLSGTSSVVFGLLYMCPPGQPFVILSLLIRAMEALGFSAVGISFTTTMCHFFPNHYASVYAVACSLSSLGCMLGPPIGAIFYEIGGFGLPFFVMGGATIVLEPLLLYLAPEIKGVGTEPKPSQTTSVSANSMSVLTLARSGLVWAGMLGLFMSAVGNVFLQPVLSTHLETFGLTPFMIGMCFALHPVLYTTFTPILGLLTDKFNLTGPLLILSCLGCCIAYSLIGPTPFISFLPRKLYVVLLGYMILGVSESGLTIPTAKCLIQGATEMGFPNDVKSHGMISGMNLGGYHFGAFVGPLLAGTLTDALGFGRSTSIISYVYLVTFVIFCSILGFRYKSGKGDYQKPEENAPLIQPNSKSCVPSCSDSTHEDRRSTQSSDESSPTPSCTSDSESNNTQSNTTETKRSICY